MKHHRNLSRLSAALAGLAVALPAVAHVGYGSALYSDTGAYDPINNLVGAGTYGAASNFTTTASSNAGFISGLDPNTLGNTHDIRFRYFTLSQASTVSFTIQGLANVNGAAVLNPAFSLYSGVVPASSHDGVGDIANVAGSPATSAYLANAPQFAAWSPFAAVNTVRGGAAAGSATNPTGLWGVFNSQGDWTTGNNGAWTATSTSAVNPALPAGAPVGSVYMGGQGVPKVGSVHYLGISVADAAAGATFTDSLGHTQSVLGADGVVDNSVTWSGVLAAGVYTLAIGGANVDAYSKLAADVRASLGGTAGADVMCGAVTCTAAYNSDRLASSLQITGFTVAAVPEPETWGMLLSGVAIVGAIARRRKQKA